jgi:cytochrome c peroxidase
LRSSLSHAGALLATVSLLSACGDAAPPEPPAAPAATPEASPPVAPGPDRAALRERARGIFGELPDEATSEANPVTEAKVELGRMLYFDPRLSKNHDISCSSCHDLASFGVDGEPTSSGHAGQRGKRNAPTVYNAAFHLSQFWDGRAADVEEQAKGPVLNPVEMAMPDGDAVVAVLRSIPGYPPLFAAAFPGEEEPLSYDNMARAIGAFERRLVTPSPFDAFLEGQDAALDDAEVAGLAVFLDTGCISCHNGPAIGGGSYQKLGAVKPYPTEDTGRFEVTGQESDRFVFKVPSLRNVARTGPWFHDGSITSLEQAIRIMAEHQLGRTLTDAQVASIAAFLASLTGEVDVVYTAAPDLPESGPDTPAPDPS